MADVITRFKLETTQYESKIRDIAKGLKDFVKETNDGGEGLDKFSKEAIEAARALGTTASGATNARDRVRDLVGAYNEAAVQFNKLSEAQQQGDFGKSLADSLEKLKQRIAEAKKELYGMGDAMNRTGDGGLFSRMGDNMSGALQVFAGNMLTKAAGMAANLATEIGECVTQGIELAKQGEGIRLAFERLDRPDLLGNLREATHGTVTNLELMKAAVKFNDFKLPLDELGTMLAFAQQKAKDTGQSVDYMVESITNGLGRQSKPILDNLSISAKEIEERMKSTGDFTKAVGDIIREQMTKAGDYIETAADRATKADVELKNAMEDLGRTFQPLADASDSLWNSIKVGALNALNSAVRPLIDTLTEAGRIRSQYEDQGGNNRVTRQVNRLKGIGLKRNREFVYNSQVRNYDTKISDYEQYLQDYKSWRDSKSVASYDRMQSFQKRTGLSIYSDVKEQLEVFKRERSEYVQGTKKYLEDNPAPSVTDTPKSTTSIKTSTRTKTEPTYAADSIAAQAKLVQDLTKQWNEAGADIRDKYVAPIIEAERKLKDMKNQLTLAREQSQGKLLGGTVQTQNLGSVISTNTTSVSDTMSIIDKLREKVQKEITTENLKIDQNIFKEVFQVVVQNGIDGMDIQFSAISEKIAKGINIPDDAWESLVEQINKKLKDMGIDPIEINFKTGKLSDSNSDSDSDNGGNGNRRKRKEKYEPESVSQVISDLSGNVGGILSGLNQLGVEIPEGLQGIIGGIQGMMTILTSISVILNTIEALQAVQSLPFFSHGGIVGRAAAGMLIPGNSNSGDNLRLPMMDGSGFIGVNSGELILNKSQQNNLANALEGGGLQGMNLSAQVSGEQILLVANRTLRRKGKGELVTWK